MYSKSTMQHLIDIETAKQLTDDYIKNYCQTRLNEAKELGPTYTRLWQSIESLLLAGGKRFRPFMVLATYQAYSPQGKLNDVLPAAVAQELIHTAMLIHDDIIDRDTVRYGISNISGQYKQYYSRFLNDETEQMHMSLSAALLGGDALISDAHRLLRKTNRPTPLIEQADVIFNKAIFEVIGGELLDTEASFLPEGKISALSIAKYKTASYSFISPITMGAVLAEAPEQDIKILTQFSEILGIGYQLRDDLLGMFGDETTTGKSATTDITEGKRTYLIEQFEQLATTEQSEAFKAIFHRKNATVNEIETAKRLLVESGAKTAVEENINTMKLMAFEKITNLTISQESKLIYKNLVERSLNRES
ncbi:MAG: hypothetical protein JWO54_636 [Candidatus Saccharibacteria bacterium]|nr:hypothetical protein [Candidatus Saccharibacteria bacterium]